MAIYIKPPFRLNLIKNACIFDKVPGRQISSKASTFFVATPIYYVNSTPHIGHIYTNFLADASQRFEKLQGISSSVFSTGKIGVM